MKGALVNLLALGVLCALLWFGGQYFEFPVQHRVAAILAALALWLLVFLWQRFQAIRTARLIEARLREQAADQIANSRPAERDQLQELEKRLHDAINALKRSKLGTSALAELPWYIIIGPPGSGKSTALQASGLEFPRIGEGLNGIAGVGGTRNCEWWFTSEGILLDTAGRYTSVAEDRAEWLGFLGMLKRARHRTPINGAIVALSIVDIIQANDDQLEGHARAVRERVEELGQELEEVFPVYLMFTKCDLLQGFVESFEALGRAEREQVWGYTFAYEDLAAERRRTILQRELGGLVDRLTVRRLELLAQERPPAVAQRLHAFPQQLAAATDKLLRFVERAFPENPFREQPLLRGVYLSSGTQEGRPIDQVLGALRAAFGGAAPAEAAAEPPREKKSYFLTNLFRRVVFPDRGLARSLASAERRRRAVHLATIAACALATVGALTLVAGSFAGNRGLTARVEAGATAAARVAKDERATRADRLKALEALRPVVAELWAHERDGSPWGLGWGLYQGGRLWGVRQAWYAELRRTLLAPCLAALEAELVRASAPAADMAALKREYGLEHEQAVYEELYELLRAYLMLGGRLTPSAQDLGRQLRGRGRWTRGLGEAPAGADGEVAAAQLAQLLELLPLVAEWAPPLDDELVARVRKKLEANYWVSQSYTMIRDTRADKAGVETAAALFGSAAELFTPTEPVSKVFTRAEWDEHFARAVGEKSEHLAAQYAEMKTPKTRQAIEQELRGYYELEGRQRWLKLLDDLHVAPFDGVEGAAKRLDLLGSPRSPLPTLVGDAWLRQHILDLDAAKGELVARPPRRRKPDEPVRPWLDQAQDELARLARAFEEASKRPRGERVYALAEADRLRELDPLQATFKEVAASLLDDIAPQAPAAQESYVRRFFREVLDRAVEALQREALAEANARWAATVHDIHRTRCAGRYPFARDAAEDAPLLEVMGMVNPATGAVWTVDKALARLRAYEVFGRGLATTGPQYARHVEGARRLRDALFPPGKEALAVALQVKLVKRPGVRNLRLTLGDDAFAENERPDHRKEMTWGTKPGAKLAIQATNQPEWIQRDFSSSPWGLLRLLDAGTLDPTKTSGRTYCYTWSFEVGGEQRLAEVELEAAREEARPVLARALFADLEAPPPGVER
ncbi:MAG: type VI secretion system membrane subunit TssM [Planctomycetes bacterium]|nr:type VI secretion system membrane subunit TssM [Planctomycetota bacterium]